MDPLARTRAIAALRGLTAVQKAVLWSLATHANNETGVCFPSLETLAAEAGCSRSTAHAALDSLVSLGHLKRGELLGRVRTYVLVATRPGAGRVIADPPGSRTLPVREPDGIPSGSRTLTTQGTTHLTQRPPDSVSPPKIQKEAPWQASLPMAIGGLRRLPKPGPDAAPAPFVAVLLEGFLAPPLLRRAQGDP